VCLRASKIIIIIIIIIPYYILTYRFNSQVASNRNRTTSKH